MMEVVHFSAENETLTHTVQRGSTACVILRDNGSGPDRITITLDVEPGARLLYIASVQATHAVHQTLVVTLHEGAQADIRGLLRMSGDHNSMLSVRSVHAGRDTHSTARIHSVVEEKAQLSLRGMIEIHNQAHHAEAFLEGRSIIIGQQAKAELIPGLEIRARDVRASHAAAAGPIDPEQVFYLTSRGLPEQQARSLILEGFFATLITDVPSNQVRQELTTQWQTHLTRTAS